MNQEQHFKLVDSPGGNWFCSTWMAALMVCAAWLSSVQAETIRVDPAKCVIVPAPMSERKLVAGVSRAAEELRKHLSLVAGRDIPVVDHVPEGAYPFFIGTPLPGDTKPLAPEEGRWQVTSQGTYFYGDPKTPILNSLSFAVYGFLESQLGIRWIAPGDEGIAYVEQTPIQLQGGVFSWAPEMLMRKIRTSWRRGQYPDLRGRDYVRDFTAYVRTNEEHDAYADDVQMWQTRMRMGSHDSPPYSHAFTNWWKKYGAEHPEYFALLENGKREPRLFATLSKPMYTNDNPRGFQEVKMCPSSPALVGQIIKNWLDSGRRSRWINVCENDGSFGYCECEECRKLDVPLPGEEPMAHLTDRYVHLANAVAREAHEIDPDVGVIMYAYDRSMLPPRREKLEPNVAVAFVPITVEMDKLEELYGGWEDAGAKLLTLRPNYPHYYNPLVIPVGCEEQMFKVFQIAYKHGARGADYDALTGQWPVSGLSDYILAHAFSEPDKPFDYWMDQYCSAFGAASGDVKRYFEYWRREVWDKRMLPNLDSILGNSASFARRIMFMLGDYYKPEDFEKSDAILGQVAKKNLTDRQRALLDQLIMANQHARLTFNAAVAPKGNDKHQAAFELLDFREAHKDQLNLNWIGTFAGETRFYGDVTGVGLAASLRRYDLPWVATGLSWRFKMDSENVGQKEEWQELTWERTKDWDTLRVDSNWENAYDSETDPRLAAKLKNYDGVAWYATRVTVPKELSGRRIFLHLAGADESYEIYVNGQLAGSKSFANDGEKKAPFAVEIGPQVDWDKTFQNVTIRVEDKGGKGGLTERLWIVSKEP